VGVEVRVLPSRCCGGVSNAGSPERTRLSKAGAVEREQLDVKCVERDDAERSGADLVQGG
jgi:hypothetical protein